MYRNLLIFVFVVVAVVSRVSPAGADLLGYWSADSTAGQGTDLPNDQGNSDLDGELFDAEFTQDGGGHTGDAGDYAVSFAGDDEDYVVIPPTEQTFEEISITAWVSGLQNGAWAGLVLSRDGSQPIGLDFHDFDGQLTYIWNDNSAETWGFISDVDVPEDEWTFVALTINPDGAVLYAGEKGGTLVSGANDIPHFEQDNFTEWRWAEDDGFAGQRNFSGLMDDVSIWNEALSMDDIIALHSGAATPLTLRGGGVEGDFNDNGILDAADIDDLTGQSANGANDPTYDLNADALVNTTDVNVWVKDLFNTWIGDANLDGLFNSGDLVAVLASGKYEVDLDSVWSTGDFDGDGRTNTSDLVFALSDGGYEKGPIPALNAVPEPSSCGWMLLSLLLFVQRRRSSRVS